MSSNISQEPLRAGREPSYCREIFVAHELKSYPQNAKETCEICVDNHPQIDYLVQIDNIQGCNHVFGYFCLVERWIKSRAKNTCPKCRAVLFIWHPEDEESMGKLPRESDSPGPNGAELKKLYDDIDNRVAAIKQHLERRAEVITAMMAEIEANCSHNGSDADDEKSEGEESSDGTMSPEYPQGTDAFAIIRRINRGGSQAYSNKMDVEEEGYQSHATSSETVASEDLHDTEMGDSNPWTVYKDTPAFSNTVGHEVMMEDDSGTDELYEAPDSILVLHPSAAPADDERTVRPSLVLGDITASHHDHDNILRNRRY